MKPYSLFILLLLLFANCNSNQSLMKKQTKEIKFITLAQASLHGNGREGISEGNYIIKDEKSFENLFSKMNSVNRESIKFKEYKVDFDKEMIIAVFSRVLGSGGSKIFVDKVIETPKNYQVKIQYKTGGGMAIMVMNQPYHIIVVPKTDKPVEFELIKN